jgi:Metallo-peptidase family M12B Reprolysin-like/Secretion system C-terminal sorting domain
MKKHYLILAVFLLLCSLFSNTWSQNSFFQKVDESAIKNSTGVKEITPQKSSTSTADIAGLRNFLWSLPDEKDVSNRRNTPVMALPMPDGSTAKFHVWKSSVMEPGLEAKYPEIRTFLGQGIDDPYATVRFDYNPYFGFSAQILSAAKGTSYIEAYKKGNLQHYQSFYKQDYKKQHQFFCEVPDAPPPAASIVAAGPCRGTQLYTYRLALACTGEYAVAVCAPNAPTVPATLAKMVVSVNRVTGVYETEVSVRMTLIANTDLLIYLDGTTDPYSNNSGGAMLSQNINTVNTIIGSPNYDIGHVFSTGGGGVAFLSCVCTGNKAGGVTGSSNPVGDPFDIDYVAHEMGHQFGGNHTFNSTVSSCGGGNRNGSTAYEVGSGTSIQAYAGICGSDNTQPNSDPFFHTVSFDEISNFLEAGGASCRTVTSTGNNLPQITSMSNNGISIPVSTPFTLSGAATDVDGDPLTYCWEEWDLGPATAWNGGNANTASPLFKSRVPKASGSRTFPDINVILANYPASPAATMGGLKGETLPNSTRTMKFRLTVRDNKAGGGGVVTGGEGCQTGFTTTFQISTVGTAGPFAVTAPNGGETWNSGSSQTVTWNVVNTNAAPINCNNVKISLSTDGGLTYPTVLLASTPNDGSEAVTIPGPASTTARIKVEAADNIFFDISNANFIIAVPPSGFEFSTPAASTVTCGTSTSSNIILNTVSNGGYNTPITLSASGVPAGTTISYSANPVTPGNGSIVTLNNINTLSNGTYNILISGVSGTLNQSVTLSYIVSPGTGPSITGQPASQTVCAGTNVTFNVTASSALSYQWQVSTDGGTNWGNIGGATAASYTVTGPTGTQNNYQYRCQVTGQCNTTASSAAVLTVNTPPAISAQPVPSTVCSGQNTSFTVGASGTGITYQWQVSTNGCASFTNLANGAPYSGVTTATLSITGATTGINNNSYRCIINGTCPGTATSNCTLLTVNTPVSLTSQPANAVLCAGSVATFSVAATGTTPTYQWQESTNGGTTWANVTNGGVYGGATTTTLTLTGVTAGMSTYQYRCVVSGAAGCTSLNSNNAVLTVNTAPAITAQPVASTTLCVGSNTAYSVTANGTALTYQWQLSTDGGTTWANVTNGGVYAGATTSTLSLAGITAGMNASQYRCVIGGTCTPSATTTNAALTVISPVAITAQPVANTSICSTGNTSFSVTGTSSVAIIYQWQVSTDGGTTWGNVANAAPYSGATTGTLTITNVPTTLNGYRYRALLSNGTCTAPTVSNVSALTVNVLPTATIATTITALQAGQSTVLTATTTPATGLNITWFKDGVLIPGATSNTYTVTVNNLGVYRAVVTDQATGTCINQSNTLTIGASPSDKLFIFPSPNDGQFTVTYYNGQTVSTTQGITIYDSYGRRVYNNIFPVNQAYQLHKIDLRRYSAGVYLVVIRDFSGKKIKTGKVVIR